MNIFVLPVICRIVGAKNLVLLHAIKFGTFWDILGYSGKFWDVLGHSGTFWDILRHSETFWEILGHSGTFWDTLGYSGIFWDILGYSGIFWDILGHSRTFWDTLSITQYTTKCSNLFVLPVIRRIEAAKNVVQLHAVHLA